MWVLKFDFSLTASMNTPRHKMTSIQILQVQKYLIWLPVTAIVKLHRVQHRLESHCLTNFVAVLSWK